MTPYFLIPLYFILMFFFFKNKKPKQFNYKTVYSKVDEGNDEFELTKHPNLVDEMYRRWDRVSYKELLAKGKQKTLITMVALVVILVLIVINLQKLTTWLQQFE